MKRLEKKENVREILSEYRRFLTTMTIFALIICFLFFTYSTFCYQKNMGYVLRMNKFYIMLDDYEQNLYQYVNDGEKESYRKVRSLEKELTDILECLNEKPVSAEYRRDVNDLKNQVKGYLKENEEIFVLMNNVIADNSDVEGLKNVIHKKEISNHSYQLLVNQFKDHYLGLLNSVNDEQTRLNRQLIFLGTFLSIVVCLLIVLANKETRAITVRVSNPLQILTEASRKIKEGYLEEFHKVVIEEPTYEEVVIQRFVRCHSTIFSIKLK